jgi:hypothetical protein
MKLAELNTRNVGTNQVSVEHGSYVYNVRLTLERGIRSRYYVTKHYPGNDVAIDSGDFDGIPSVKAYIERDASGTFWN